MGPKHTGELWVYIVTPLPNPSGNTGVMVCVDLFCTVGIIKGSAGPVIVVIFGGVVRQLTSFDRYDDDNELNINCV